jgi:hypothetical protein
MVAVNRSADVLRIFDRYLVEVIERYELCPWARTARERGEIAAGVLWDTPTLEAWVAEATQLLAQPSTRIAMVIAPEADVSGGALRAVRDAVAARLPSAGVAEFHPDAPLDLVTPARLVPFLRRSPDPMLQLVPLAVIDAVRAAPTTPGRGEQASMLGGHAELPRLEVTARIAAANHAMVAHSHAALSAVLDAISEDRRAAYARVGIRTPASRS